MTEKKEEWKEILEAATFEEKTEKDISSEPIAENIAEVAPVEVEKPKDFEEVDREMIGNKAKREFRSRLILVFALGFLIGIAIKTEALKSVTVGFNDYLMKSKSQNYNINQLELDLAKARDAATRTQMQESDGEVSPDSQMVPTTDKANGVTDQTD